MEDPAVTVGLAIHFARISLAQRAPLPPVIIELLARRVEEGDPACVMVAEWLETCGLLHLKPLTRSKRRLGLMDTRLANHLLWRLRHRAQACGTAGQSG